LNNEMGGNVKSRQVQARGQGRSMESVQGIAVMAQSVMKNGALGRDRERRERDMLAAMITYPGEHILELHAAIPHQRKKTIRAQTEFHGDS
ncbi:hypothetical protein, partial [Devosia limi]|uniref:hypothetical protein n=1 Tax=Devosia limi TaxID=288995 RepID=UPI001AEBD5AA